jgi:hypothetical protein
MNDSQQRELIDLWLQAGEGAADEAQLARLNHWLETDAQARACVLEVARQQGWLAWHAADVPLPAALATLAPQRSEGADSQAHSVARSNARRQRWAWASLAASLLGVAAAAWYSVNQPGANVAQNDAAPIRATIVSSTGCLWASGDATSPLGTRPLGGGDSLQLVEGIAEFRLGAGDSRLQMEGPASVVLTAQGAASMNYGKVVIKTGAHAGPYPIETSFGRVMAQPQSEVGLIGFGSKAEIHCFRGRVLVDSPWLSANDADVASVSLEAGEALQFTDVGGATLQSRREVARENRFTPQVSMNTDFLSVSPDYVREIVAARPAAYWRFEDSDGGVLRNEMGPAYQCQVKGEVSWVGPEGNRAIELGMNDKQGSLRAAESWDGVLGGDFSIEAWIKPSHFHLGSVVGFVGEFDPVVGRNKHGVLLETCGPSRPSDWLRVNQVRFLHRSQLTADPKDGVSCFSGEPYEPRRWQHVVAVKQGDQLSLYVDGELKQAATDDQPTPNGLHLVIGQLYTETVERFFRGQLDEVAIYARALEADEVAEHHKLLRPVVQEQTPVRVPAA